MNKKVPFAILSCFLIAFVLQGLLKMCGVFVFEKVITWDIFRIIDQSKILTIIFYLFINGIACYCLSFALTSNPYSKKYWHYILIFGVTLICTIIRCNVLINIIVTNVLDVLNYIVVPIIINMTTDKQYKLYTQSKITNLISVITLQILFYFIYIGLNFWSGLLNSIIPSTQYCLYISSNFLIIFEVFIGLGLLMSSINMIIREIKSGGGSMFVPMNIASDEAKEKELQEHKEKLENKKKK
jgi:hypothetical protein